MATEKWLIDANTLMYEVLNHPKPYRKDFYRMLKDAPTVDAVEVVRCNACQSHEPCAVKGRVWCKKLCRYMKEDGFCSEGVKGNG